MGSKNRNFFRTKCNPHNIKCKWCGIKYEKYYKTEYKTTRYVTLLSGCGNTYCFPQKEKNLFTI